MAVNSAFRIGRTLTSKEASSESAIEELRTAIQDEISVGTSAPDSKTSGHIYFKVGSSSTDAIVVYVKDRNGDWNGG